MWRISAYKDRITLLAATIGSWASLMGLAVPLFLSVEDKSALMGGLIVFSVFLMIVTVIAIVRTDIPYKVYRIGDARGIRDYMFHWIKNGSRVAIWTRDLSWAADEELDEMLRQKAQRSELIICLPENIEKTDSLKASGADIVAYGTSETPASIFTIVNYRRTGSRVAVGMRKGNHHIIQEFSSDEHPTFHLAMDLVELARGKASERQ